MRRVVTAAWAGSLAASSAAAQTDSLPPVPPPPADAKPPEGTPTPRAAPSAPPSPPGCTQPRIRNLSNARPAALRRREATRHPGRCPASAQRSTRRWRAARLRDTNGISWCRRKQRRPGRVAPASCLVLPVNRRASDARSASSVRSTEARKDLRALNLDGRQRVRVEPQEGEDRRCDLSGLDGGGLDLNR
jgi:hypothetical protein